MKVHWRRWSDLSMRRVVLVALLAPVSATCLFSFIFYGTLLSLKVLTFLPWFLILEIGYLLGIARSRRKIARIECILLGVLGTWTFQFAIAYIRHFLPVAVLAMLQLGPVTAPLHFILHYWSERGELGAQSIVLAVGLFTGWLFWALAIRPALQPIDLSAFD